jgi:hypothetical protein
MSDWGRDAKRAMTKSPSYFVWWYTAKSLGLGLAVALVAFLWGREVGRGTKGQGQ